MGGDAFPATERLSEVEYWRVVALVQEALAGRQPPLVAGVPVEVRDKAELCRARGKDRPYGDVDFIVGLQGEVETRELVDLVRTAVGSESTVLKNDSTYSFLTKEAYQIDIKFCKEENLDFLLAFKSNNDFGALLGHLLTPLKLKWSEAGLGLRLKAQAVPGLGTRRQDFPLTRSLQQVCGFLGLPATCLDGETSLSSREIFDTLTNARVFFVKEYDEKYKIKERRKKRPVSDAFFNLIEEQEAELEVKKRAKYNGDELENMFHDFRNEVLSFDDYIKKVADYFGKGVEVEKALHDMKLQSDQEKPGNIKFNFSVVTQWLPDLSPRKAGKVMSKVKSSHQGETKGVYEQWVEDTAIEDIKAEVERIAATLPSDQD